MTDIIDIEALKDAVIEAARVIGKECEAIPHMSDTEKVLVAAIAALDAALEPDPWQILKELVRWDAVVGSHKSVVRNALDWKAKHD